MEKNRYIVQTNTIEGRSFIYNLILEKCGVDITEGVTILKTDDEFTLGRKSIALEVYNALVRSCPESIKLMEKEMESYDKY